MASLVSPRLRVRTEHPYHGRIAVLGTKHGKGSLIALPLLGTIGLRVRSLELDTDLLGTFAGDVPRTLPMREAAIAKARMAMDESGCPLGLASEGTIGPDPHLPLLVSDRELIVLVDAETGAVYQESVRSLGIIVASTLARPGDDLDAFCARAAFGDHRLIVRPDGIDPVDLPGDLIHKAIGDRRLLHEAIRASCRASPTGLARIESDLRAHCCPSRRTAIAQAAWRLGQRLACRCPACQAPGWGVIGDLLGLACSLCGEWVPRALRGRVLGCARCGHQVDRPGGQREADPSTCPACNP